MFAGRASSPCGSEPSAGRSRDAPVYESSSIRGMPTIEFHDVGEVGTLRVAGPDAAAFLQGQLTADIRTLAPDSGQLAAWCSPQGRVIALMRLVPTEDGFLALMPRALAGDVAERLARFVLRARVRIEDASSTLAVAGLAGSTTGVLAGLSLGEGSQVRLAQLPGPRCLAIGTPGPVAALRDRWPAAPDGAWDALAVSLGEPEVYPATSEAWVPQMLNLDLLGAVSFRKGCYPGQEIVARTQNLGRIKRRLFRYHLTGPGLPSAGSALLQGGTKVGEVVRVASHRGRSELLAVVNLDACGTGLLAEEGGATCTPEPLPYAVPDAVGAT
jgi:folate-binding protein YgfZ